MRLRGTLSRAISTSRGLGNQLWDLAPSLDLRFAETKSLVDATTGTNLVDFTRASSGTYVGSDGLIKTAATNQARFDHDPVTDESLGLLVEEARTNLLSYSEKFSTGSWVKLDSAVVDNAATAPDGTITAGLLFPTATVAASYTYKTLTTAGQRITYSVYAKAQNKSVVWLYHYSGASYGVIYFDLSDGTVQVVAGADQTADYSIAPAGNGWYRVSGIWNSFSASANWGVGVSDAKGSGNVTANGTDGVLIWGAQLEAGSFPTSYIPTPATFTSRSTTATYYDSNGTIQTAGINVARDNAYFPDENGVFKPAGLLLEAAGTNLVTYSEQFDIATWGKLNLTVTANAAVSPDGTTTADKIVATNATGVHSLFSTSISAGTYTFSVFAKKAEYSRLVINYYGISFNLDTGVIESTLPWQYNSSAKIEKFPNGWYRCSVTGTASGNLYLSLSNAAPAGNLSSPPSFTGDGTSGIYLWGAQIEASSYPTSYIPTTTSTVTRAADVSSSSTVTRAADVAQITGTNFSSWYNQSEGTLSFTTLSKGNAFAGYLQGASNTNRIDPYQSNSFPTLVVVNNGTNIVNTASATPMSFIAKQQFAVGIKQGAYALAQQGTVTITGTNSTSPPTVTQMFLGRQWTPLYLNGTISRLTYYPVRLPDATLQTITS